MSEKDIIDYIAKGKDRLSFDMITISILQKLKSSILEADKCILIHPSGNTLVHWLECCGFYDIEPAHCGGWFTGLLFDELPESKDKMNMEEIEAFLKPIIRVVTQMQASIDDDQSGHLNIRATK